MKSAANQLVSPSFARADELDAASQAEGFEFAFDGLEAAAQVICNAGGSQLPAIAEQFQDPQTPTCWCVLDLNRIGLGFPGVPNRDPIVESVSSPTTGNDVLLPADQPQLCLE